MKEIVTATEVGWKGLESLLGQQVMIFCLNYIYAGELAGINATCIQLKNPKIVYETGPFNQKGYADAQGLPAEVWHVQISAIESFGLGK
jgi:hypothetical protein